MMKVTITIPDERLKAFVKLAKLNGIRHPEWFDETIAKCKTADTDVTEALRVEAEYDEEKWDAVLIGMIAAAVKTHYDNIARENAK